MQVPQLHAEFASTTYVTIVVSLLPKYFVLLVAQMMLVPQVRVPLLDANLGFRQTPHLLTERQLQIMHRISQGAVIRVADKQMDVLRHDHVAIDPHLELAPHCLQAHRKEIT